MLKNHKKRKKQHSKYLIFSSQVIQMALIIFFGAYLGDYLDEKTQNKTPVITIVLSLLAVFTSLYIFFKKNINKNNENN